MKQQSRIDYQLSDKFDLVLFFSAVSLIIIGLVAIYSATYNNPSAASNFQKQSYFAVFSVVVFLITYFVNPRTFNFVALPTYFGSLLLLVAVIFIGKKVYGQRCWLDFGPLSFQPSELAKIGTIFFLSLFLSSEKRDIESMKDVGIALAAGLFPVLLILAEPDMGTALIFFVIILAMIFWKGISLFGLFVVLSPGIVIFASMFGVIPLIAAMLVIGGALLYFKKNLFFSASIFVMNLAAGFLFDTVYNFLSPHQQKLIGTFVDPGADPLGSGYNAIQARVAIGSGGFFGKGFLQGNQTQLRFIPEQWTDFIFCVIGEEFGFIGAIITVTLFFFLLMRLLKIASFVKDKSSFQSLVVIGILAVFFAHFFINIGMTIGLMPIIGIPLPLLSYGGSSLMVNMFMLGIAANIHRNRKQYA